MTNATEKLSAKQHSGLDLSGLGDLASMLDMPVSSDDDMGLRFIDISCIREDEGNSRTASNPGFSAESIEELAQSMGEGRGVKSPLSLRSDPERPGKYIINHGHRRFRAARLAGLTQVPAFIDESFDKFDQVIENIHRENLTSREVADFIGAAMAEGRSAADVARLLGKSKAFVSQHVALLDLPEPVAQAYQSGRVRDVTVLNELVRAHRENPEAVAQVLAGSADELAAKPVNRDAVKALRAAAKPKEKKGAGASDALRQLQARLSQRLGAEVTIDAGKRDVVLQVRLADSAKLQALLRALGLDDLVGSSV